MAVSTFAETRLLRPTLLPDGQSHLQFRKLGRHDADQVFDVMKAAGAPGVVPPEMILSIDDATRLVEAPSRRELDLVTGAFGTFDSQAELGGFVALSELDLDAIPHLEFYIFFRPEASRPNIVGASVDLIRFARTKVPDPICTLIYPANDRAKTFYAKAGFRYDRLVMLDSMTLEMWLWHEDTTPPDVGSAND